MKKITIIGAGAIGGVVGAYLARQVKTYSLSISMKNM
jgi:ketopantoate reductase